MAGSDLIQSVLRAAEILERIAQAPQGLRVNDVARALGVKPPTAHNLLRTLTAKEFVCRNGDGRFVLGAGLLRLTCKPGDLLGLAGPAMQALSERLPEVTVTLSELHEGQIEVVLRISPDRPGDLQRPTGAIFGLYSNASGLAQLAWSSEDERLALLEAFGFYEHGVRLWDTQENLNAFLERARADGVVTLPFPEPVLRAAAPILAQGRLQAVLGLSVRGIEPGDERESRYAESVRQAAQELSARL